LEIGPVWARFNDELIRLVDYVPEDQINWSPKPELWNFRGILLHIAATRDGWLGGTGDGEDVESVWTSVRTKDEIKQAYARTWQRVERFLADPARLAATYKDDEGDVTGHWIAFHLLEHDIHHRADIFHYLALLGIETPGVGTP
jgi:uncharacterized damage-inducible protein DinB